MKSREDLFAAPEARIEEFLSDLAVNGHVAALTQNQAFNGRLFLYRHVLHQDFGNVWAVRADRAVRVPVVFTSEEVKQVVSAMSGLPQLVVKLLYGSGLRLSPVTPLLALRAARWLLYSGKNSRTHAKDAKAARNPPW